jgi:N-methylhydantoinase B
MTNISVIDPISLEILRTRLLAVAEEGALTVQRTACSPVIAESGDNACALLDARGDLIAGAGSVAYNFGVCSFSVKHILAMHGDGIVPGDVFLANDPHNGGGLHAQDVIIQRPIFLHDTLIGWVSNVGHMMDMGGMAFGSWAPAATECYQEALRLPPVRIFKAGVEQADIWSIIRNNIRVAVMVEMDLRSLVAGCQVANDKFVGIAAGLGIERFRQGLSALRTLAEREIRRRIERLADGVYCISTWTEWDDELYAVPCRLTIAGDAMTFDFEGAAPQAKHFFNSKPQIIEAIVVSDVTSIIAHDMPLSAGLFAPMTVRCPAGSVVNSAPPAPIASSHFDVALNASMAAHQCVMMAIAASGEDAPGRHLLSGPVAPSCMGLHTWSYTTPAGTSDGWLTLEGSMVGGSAGFDRDGYDLCSFMVARKPIIESIDVEVFEQCYPVLVDSKRMRSGAYGAGKYRAGASSHMLYRPHGTPRWVGVMLGMRARVPLPGFAGGFPGSRTRFLVYRSGGKAELVRGHENGLIVDSGDVFAFELGSGGGFGDPVDRDPESVALDVNMNRLTRQDAADVYGVCLVESGRVDVSATARQRTALLRKRLDAARPPARPMDSIRPPAGTGSPLYVGIEQRGDLAVVSASGTVLARAPDLWTDGCPVLVSRIDEHAEAFAYLDPSTGKSLLVDVVPAGMLRATSSLPKRWTDAAGKPVVTSGYAGS